MKKMIALLLALLCLVVPALAEMPDLTQYTDEELRLLRDNVYKELAFRNVPGESAIYSCTIRGSVVALCEVKRAEGWKGEDGIALFFSLTNGGSDTTSFTKYAWIEVYQNGVQCESIGVDGTDSTTWSRKVQPGATVDGVSWGFELLEHVGVIEIAICDASDWRKPVMGSVFIDLSEIE